MRFHILVDDFIRRLPKDGGNKRQLENLIKAGAFLTAFITTGGNLLKGDQIIAQSLHWREAESSQVSLFGAGEQEDLDSKLSSPCPRLECQ